MRQVNWRLTLCARYLILSLTDKKCKLVLNTTAEDLSFPITSSYPVSWQGLFAVAQSECVILSEMRSLHIISEARVYISNNRQVIIIILSLSTYLLSITIHALWRISHESWFISCIHVFVFQVKNTNELFILISIKSEFGMYFNLILQDTD
jgi:hypothetical protein